MHPIQNQSLPTILQSPFLFRQILPAPYYLVNILPDSDNFLPIKKILLKISLYKISIFAHTNHK